MTENFTVGSICQLYGEICTVLGLRSSPGLGFVQND